LTGVGKVISTMLGLDDNRLDQARTAIDHREDG
jgi:hypothetical protein